MLLVAAELRPLPLPWVSLPTADAAGPAYAWLATQDDVGAIFEAPCYRIDDDLRWMWLQPLHGKPLANGYSGYFPPGYQTLKDHACWPLPDAEGLDRLRSLGVTHLVVHPPSEWQQRWMRKQVWAFASSSGLEELYSQDLVRVFRLGPMPPATGQGARKAPPRDG